ncbi:MAG: flagellar brake protein [Planctomycetota bacterium]
MPARRSRTDRWRDGLAQIQSRGGGLEIAVDHGSPTDRLSVDSMPAVPDLIWRVRLHGVGEDEIEVEHPGALGHRMDLPAGTPLIVAMTIGQNRWMFRSTVAGERGPERIRLILPETVERCTRRSQHRVSTAELNLPAVRCWVLNDPSTATKAENAARAEFGQADPDDTFDLDQPPAGVDLGRGFQAELANIGGGGLGLIVQPEEVSAISGTRLYYTRLDLRPIIARPLELTVRMAHSHSDSRQVVHAGVAFDFGLNPSHKDFIISQIDRYTRHLHDAARAAAA